MYVNGFAELRQHVPQAGMKWITIPVEGLSGSQSLGCTGAVANGVGTVAPLRVMTSFSIRRWVDGRVFFSSFFFAVPSFVPTSEALLPRRSSRHPSPPATPRAHSASRPRPQRSTGSDVRSLVGCHPKETLHCC